MPSMTAELGDLLCWLLEKQPQNRCDWTEVSVHPFWGRKSNAAPVGLPEEAAFKDMVQSYERAYERSMEQALMRECGMSENQAQDLVRHRDQLPLTNVHSTQPGSAVKAPLQPHVSDSTPIRPAAKVTTSATDCGNRLADVFTIPEDSRAEGKEEARGHPDKSKENSQRANSERTPDRGQRLIENKDLPPSQYATPVVNRAITISGIESAAAPQPPLPHLPLTATPGSSTKHPPATLPATIFEAAQRVTTPSAAEMHLQQPDGSYFGARSPSHTNQSHLYGGADVSAAVVNQVTPGLLGNMSPATLADPIATIWPQELSAEELLIHAQDTQVKPVVGNKNIEALEKYPVKTANMPFEVLSQTVVQELSSSDLEQHLTTVYKAIQKATAEAAATQSRGGASAGSALCAERIQMLSYLASIGSISEVANIVLNTNFVNVLLKLIKGPTTPSAERSGSRGSSREGARAVVVTPAMSSLRSIAATVLATMLRYATYVSPPSSKAKDEHIIPLLTGILRSEYTTGSAGTNGTNSIAGTGSTTTTHSANKEGLTRLDPKLKRRVIAALGETLFYISSQEGEPESEDARWTIPTTTIACLVRCMRDDSDEIVRHYAAKTIENVLAQGGAEHKKRLVSVDVAARLLEMSQHGRNEALQATCGMALSHMFTYVLTAEHAVEEPLSPGRGGAGITTKLARTTNRSPSVPGDNGVAAGAGARFMVKVLDRGGLPAMLETLNDGQPKLQQAYLNILNLLFAIPRDLAQAVNKGTQREEPPMLKGDILSARMTSRNSSTVPGAAELRSTRQFFLRSATLVPTILKLVETGASTAVRAKALLTAQLLCDHQPSLLVQFCERRLPAVLMRLVEPLVLAASGAAGQSVRNSLQRLSRGSEAGVDAPATAVVPQGSAAYPMQAALSFLAFVRNICTSGAAELAVQIERVASVDGDATFGGTYASPSHASPSKTRIRSPAAALWGVDKRSPAVNVKTPSSVDKRGTSASRPSSRGGTPAIAPDLGRIHALAEIVRAAVASAALPSLRRLILADGPDLVLAVTAALAALPKARAGLATLSSSEPFAVEAIAALAEAEQALLVALEGIAAVDAADLTLGIGSHAARHTEQAYAFATDEGVKGAGSFAEALSLLLPVVAGLCKHAEGDVRVIIAAALRRLLPGALRALLHCVKERTLLQTRCTQCMHVPCGEALLALLADQSPIPQYAVRMLNESMAITPDIADLLTRQLVENDALPAIVSLFSRQAQSKGETSANGGSEDERDPQLVLLLRAILERKNAAMSVLQAGLAQALCSAIHGPISQQIQTEEEGRNMAQSQRLAYLISLVPVVELMHVTLHYVIKQMSSELESDRKQAAHAMGLVSPCNLLCSSLLSMLITALLDLSALDAATEGASTVAHTADTLSRSLGILFDLFPDTISNSLCRTGRDPRNPYAVDLRIKGRDSTAGEVLAAVLTKGTAHARLRSRILKIVSGVCSMAAKLGTVAAARSLLQSSSMQRALRDCSEIVNDKRAIDSDSHTLAALARQCLSAGAIL